MRIEIGPVSAASAAAWLDYGTEVIAMLAVQRPANLSTDALEAFDSLIAEWRSVLDRGGAFHWIVEESPDRVEFLMKALYEAGLAVESLHESGVATLRPVAADEFHVALVTQVLAALEHEGPPHEQFVESLREEWGVAGRDRLQVIHHLALRDEWEEAVASGGPYRRSTIGASLEDLGYIHCCFPHQLHSTVARYFAGRDDVLVLTIDPGRLEERLVVESVGGEQFPHLYGPLALDAVVKVQPYRS